MNHEAYGYGLWGMVVFSSAIFLIFAFSSRDGIRPGWAVISRGENTLRFDWSAR
jgi:hypothetical protein